MARERRAERLNLRLFMRGYNRDPEPSRTFCFRRISDGRD